MMIGGFNVNEFLATCREISLNTTNAFERSAFVPTSEEVGSVTREILTRLMANSSAMSLKLTLSGSIAEEKKSDKKQSFCSEFNQMTRNIIGLLGFEFAKFLEIHMGTFAYIKLIIEDMKEATSYKELKNYTSYIYQLLKPCPKCTYKFARPAEQSKISTLVTEDRVSSFFEHESSELAKHISARNISMFLVHKDELIKRISDFIANITEGSKTIETIDGLVYLNMGKDAIVYDDSFLKLFEVLYKSINADNPGFNEKNPALVKQFCVVERYVDEVIKLPSKQSANYISELEHYFMEISKITQEAMYDDTEILADVKKMNVLITVPLITLLAKITFAVLVRLAKLINWKKDVLLITSTPSRIQFAQVFEAFICLQPGIDTEFRLDQLIVIHYILSCLKVANVTKQKKKLKDAKRKATEEDS